MKLQKNIIKRLLLYAILVSFSSILISCSLASHTANDKTGSSVNKETEAHQTPIAAIEEHTSVSVLAPASFSQELKGVWIPYLEWETWPKDEAGFQAAVNQTLDNCVNLGMNAVFVHVRPDSDAMYPSKYFPWSKFASGEQGKDPGYDPLAYFIQAAHSRGLEFHAWINPYRITGYLNRWEDVADTNPAKMWLNDTDSSNDRWVLLHRNEYYYNPSVLQVQELIINGVLEIVTNYDVDGIHFDDYFYPQLDDSNPSLWFDKPEYDLASSSSDLVSWRRNNVNMLVKGVYKAIHSVKPEVIFGISPQGYVEHLRSDSQLFVDIDTWMSKDGYVDYVMPQIYWGFEHKTSDGQPAPFAYEQNLQTWIKLKNTGNTKLYIGLPAYKTATDTKDNNEIPEWKRFQDILKRQVESGRATKQVDGYCFYSYSSLLRPEASEEVKNLMSVLK